MDSGKCHAVQIDRLAAGGELELWMRCGCHRVRPLAAGCCSDAANAQ
jgi:N-methylhydantoinase A/oxoprolinase/acetone carboxylase beta subunit